jgi:UDP-N-acetylmuramoyl-L-alanyl-D-glutamate--2,6-diaminopimelate ligase
VLIAGKGHEDYQIVGRAKLPFCDLEQARRALASRTRGMA